MKVCVLSDSELKEFDPSQYLDAYSWDIFIPHKVVVDFIGAHAERTSYDVYFILCDGADNPQEESDGVRL